MDWTRLSNILRARARTLFRRRAADADAHDELAFHLAMQTHANIRSGMEPADAERAARRDLGSPTRISEDLHDLKTLPFVETLWQDVRFGVRLLRRNPTFALVAVLTLALGTGANAAIFELMNALELRSIPVTAPNELVALRIDQHGKGRVGMGLQGGLFTAPLYREIAARQQAFSSLVAWSIDRWNLSTEGEVVWARGQYVSANYFSGLGIRPTHGRLFADNDDRDGCGGAAVLSHSFWRSRYGGDPAVIGRTISLDGHAFPIAGISAEGFSGLNVGRSFDVALPLCAEPQLRGTFSILKRRDAWWLDVVGRLIPGWTVDRARTHVAAISAAVFGATTPTSYKPEWARNYTAFTLNAEPAATGSLSYLRVRFSAPLRALFAVTVFVLALTCANLANLMLARSTARSREIAVRLAIGASRRRIVRQLLAESGVIAVAGTLVGALLGRWMSRWFVAFLSTSANPIFLDLSPDWRAFGFLAAAAVTTCVMFGLSPALTSTRRDLAASMQAGGGRSSSDGHEGIALRRGLVVAQVALSIALVIGALLFTRTLRNLGSVSLGFEPHVTSVAVDLRRTVITARERAKTFGDIRARLEQVPGVQHAAEALIIPLSGGDWNGAILRDSVVQKGDAHFNEVGGEYFRTMQIPLLGGRTFDGRDRVGTPKVVVVSQTFARTFFPDGDAIGRTFQLDVPPPQPTYTIVGVVGDSKIRQIREERTGAGASFTSDYAATFLPIAYVPVSQDDNPPPELRVVLRTSVPTASMSRVVTQTITDMVPGAAVSYESVIAFVDDVLMTERLMAWLSAFFGVLAVLIAVIGLYGVMSYLVSRRRVEIGVRMALGAEAGAVVRMILGDSAKLLLAGCVGGVALAVVVTRYAAAMLFGLSPVDPVSFASGIAVLALASLVACYLPARRATRIDPTAALREV